jgi:hypothetical protein
MALARVRSRCHTWPPQPFFFHVVGQIPVDPGSIVKLFGASAFDQSRANFLSHILSGEHKGWSNGIKFFVDYHHCSPSNSRYPRSWITWSWRLAEEIPCQVSKKQRAIQRKRDLPAGH